MAKSALERPHVVIISNDLSLSTFLTQGLLQEGFWTSAIGSGLQALEVFRLRDFDAAVIDFGLGDISSLELVRRLRGTSDRSTGETARTSIPIVVVTGAPGEATIPDIQDAGANALLEPPLDIEDVSECLKGVLGRQSG